MESTIGFDEIRFRIFLGVEELEERHTSDYIVSCMEDILSDWDIPIVKVVAIVTDGGANIVAACKTMFGEDKHLTCFAHQLNTIVSNSLEDTNNSKLTSAIQKLKRIVTWFHQSVVAADELRKLTDLKLIQSVPTRWNSTLHMIERYLKISNHVVNALLQNPKSPTMLTSEEQQILQEAVSFLRVFDEITTKVSSESVVTVSEIFPYSKYILRHLQKQEANTVPGQLLNVKLKTVAKDKFDKYETHGIISCSTILDPRFKKIHFENARSCVKGKEIILFDKIFKTVNVIHST